MFPGAHMRPNAGLDSVETPYDRHRTARPGGFGPGPRMRPADLPGTVNSREVRR